MTDTATSPTADAALQPVEQAIDALVLTDNDRAEIVNALRVADTEADTLARQESVLEVGDNADFEIAAALTQRAIAAQKQVVAALDGQITKANKLHKAFTGLRGFFVAPLQTIEHRLKSKQGAYIEEQDRIRRDAEAKARREAAEREEKERARLAKLEEAARARGDEAKAAEFAERQETVMVPPAPVAVPAAPAIKGTSTVSKWKIDGAVDLPKFLEAALRDLNLRGYITINTTKLEQTATRLQGEFHVPGVTFRKTTEIRQRT